MALLKMLLTFSPSSFSVKVHAGNFIGVLLTFSSVETKYDYWVVVLANHHFNNVVNIGFFWSKKKEVNKSLE